MARFKNLCIKARLGEYASDEFMMSGPRVHYKVYRQLDGSQQRLVQRVGSVPIIKRFDRTPLPIAPTDVVCPHLEQ